MTTSVQTQSTPTLRRKSKYGVRYGWIPDLPDQRDIIYSAPLQIMHNLPEQMDLRESCPAIYDQGQLGSCTANAIAGLFEFDLKKQGLKDFMPSRLFIYYNEREVEGTISEDSGAYLRDGIKCMAKIGVCPEKEWPYEITKFASKPKSKCFEDAKKDKAVNYARLVRTLGQLRSCLASGFPFVFGFSVYESFESDKVAETGIVPLPKSTEKLLGGHAVLAVGYDQAERMFIVRNSWGTDWGIKGYFKMPYDYLLNENLADDFWTIRSVT